MLEIFLAYRKYPYEVSFRVRFFNIFRYFFKFSFLEHLLIANLLSGKKFWRRFIPPFYFYKQGSTRNVKRNGINYSLDLSHLIDHSIFFYTMDDPAQENLFKVLKPQFITVDVGANIGFITLNFARY
jgi:hypothetical protein